MNETMNNSDPAYHPIYCLADDAAAAALLLRHWEDAIPNWGGSRAARLEAALRRIVEAQALAMWANASADHATYETLANDRDDAIEAAAALVEDDE